jgi:hypothetical protein
MLNEALRRELLDLREEDRRVRNELADASELGAPMFAGWRRCISGMRRVYALSFRMACLQRLALTV